MSFDFTSFLRGLHPDTSPSSATASLATTILPLPACAVPYWHTPGEGDLDATLRGLPPGRALLVDGSGATLGQVPYRAPHGEPRGVAQRFGGPAA
jgi:hypothetical protein